MHATPSFGDKSWADFGFSLGYCFCGVYEYGIGGNTGAFLIQKFERKNKYNEYFHRHIFWTSRNR